MNIDKNSNGFTFGFAFVLVVVVGTLLSVTSMSLKPRQARNTADKKRMDILAAIQVDAKRSNASELYSQYVVDSYVINSQGQKVDDGPDAFSVDVRQQYRDQSLTDADRYFPLYICEKEGNRYYVIPMAGTGLWGPIWGYVSLEADYRTIYGASFDHKSETPGLGAEIRERPFQAPFTGKLITDESGQYEPIILAKGGAAPGSMHEVDAITGGTITSKAVEEMINRTLEIYYLHFSSK